jgi:MraZ protein
MPATYFGTSEHGLDDKGRLILPGRILDRVARQDWRFFLTAGLERCLLLHDSEGWEELVRRIGHSVLSSRPLRSLRRRFFGHSEEVQPDSSRRIRIPDPLLKYAGLEASKPVVLVGSGRIVEIWSPAHLEQALGEPTPEEESLFDSLVDPIQVSPPGA